MKVFSVFCFVFFVLQVPAQQQNNRSRSEVGVLGGGSYYIGDLNVKNHFKNTELAFGGIYRYNVNPRFALRSNFTYGKLNASDSDSKLDIYKNRNLSFQTDFYELASGVEFNFVPYQTGHKIHRVTGYIVAQIGVFRINPQTEYNGALIDLQELGTEGQGTVLSDKDLYSKTQICVPVGLGSKFSLSKNVSLSLEFTVKKTFTDYIDDVGRSRFVDRDQLSELNGPLVGELSNRNLNGSKQGFRGNPSTNDWYFVFGAILAVRLGPPNKCYNH
jgi:hypothetical protein